MHNDSKHLLKHNNEYLACADNFYQQGANEHLSGAVKDVKIVKNDSYFSREQNY